MRMRVTSHGYGILVYGDANVLELDNAGDCTVNSMICELYLNKKIIEHPKEIFSVDIYHIRN